MTIDEMTKVILDYCSFMSDGCGACVLDDDCRSVMGDFIHNPEVCTRAYNKIKYLVPTKAPDNVEYPAHYNQGNIECIDAMVSAFGKDKVQTYCHINAFKYLWRKDFKNGTEDIKKAIWYLKKYVALEEQEGVTDND